MAEEEGEEGEEGVRHLQGHRAPDAVLGVESLQCLP